jgi:hypothetical protein
MARKLEGVEENWDIVSMSLGDCQGEYHANDLTQALASASTFVRPFRGEMGPELLGRLTFQQPSASFEQRRSALAGFLCADCVHNSSGAMLNHSAGALM